MKEEIEEVQKCDTDLNKKFINLGELNKLAHVSQHQFHLGEDGIWIVEEWENSRVSQGKVEYSMGPSSE